MKVEAEGIIAGVLANVGHDGGMTAREGASSAWVLWAASAHLALFGHGGVVRRALGSCAHTGASPMFPRITILSRRSRAPSRCLGGKKPGIGETGPNPASPRGPCLALQGGCVQKGEKKKCRIIPQLRDNCPLPYPLSFHTSQA